MKTCFKTTTTCRNNEECYLDKIVDSHFNTSFNAGCRERNHCSNLIGRRELHASDSKRGLWTWKVCSECCSTVNRTLPCNAALCNQGCLSAKSDIVFLLDSSSSIGNNLFEHTLKTFAVDFINNPTMLIGPEYNQIGLVSFTGHSMKATALNRFHDKATMTDAVLNNLHFETGTTETHEALQLVQNLIFTPLFGDRRDAENVLVIITDGGSHFPPKTLQEAEKLKKAGVRIYVIGVGDYINPAHLMEINGMSSGILSAYGLNSYNPKAIQELLWKSICQHVSTRPGDGPGQQSTAKVIGTSSQIGKVSTRTKPHSTPKPTIRITVPTAPPLSKSSSSAPSTTQKKLTMRKTKSTSTTKVVSGVPTASVTVVQNTPKWVSLQMIKSTSPSPCVDNALCIASGVSICNGVYANWARGSCPKLCGFCKATTSVTALALTLTPTAKQTKPRSPPTTTSPTTTPQTTTSPTTTPPTTTSPITTPPTTTSPTTTLPTTTPPTTTSPTTTPPTTTSPTIMPPTTTPPTTTSPTTTAPTTTSPTTTSPTTTSPTTTMRTTTLPTTTSPTTTPPTTTSPTTMPPTTTPTTTSPTTTSPTTTSPTTTPPTTTPPTTTSPTTTPPTTTSQKTTQKSPTTTGVLSSSKYVCRDQANCIAFGPTVCGRNVAWAKTNCGAYCGYCSPPITTGTSQTSVTTLGSSTTAGPSTKPSTSVTTTSKPTTSLATTTRPTTSAATTKKPTTTSAATTTKPTTSAATTKKPTTTSAATTPKPTTTSAATTPKPTTTSAATTTKATTSAATTKKPTTSATTTSKPTTTSVATTTKPTSAATTKKPTTMLSFAWKTIIIPG